VFLLKELSKVFPSIPLVAEEDSDFVRSNNLVDSVVSVVTDKASSNDKPLTNADVLEAIDRGGKNAIVYGTRPATYWVSLSKLPVTKVKIFSQAINYLYSGI
jgi:3'(2'), 5'-bisphosphate nucleotidase